MCIQCNLGQIIRFYSKSTGYRNRPIKDQGQYWNSSTKNKKEVRGFLRCINYNGRFSGKHTTTCEPLFKITPKIEPMVQNNDCEIAFKKIKTYLLNLHVLVPSVPGRPILMYLRVCETSMGCVLCQHDELGKKEQSIYYLSKKTWRKLDAPWCGQRWDCGIICGTIPHF